ncbi:serine/threonine protein kinase [Gorillibacterium timonense]|uniref:serine/threonine protein kinase n=1 Tax=Gorillibacterium timonense TaxID=1689269 RepID=UPI00071D9B5A|nr:serine/threonine-protein kinase [Gorillibacterium timonense]
MYDPKHSSEPLKRGDLIGGRYRIEETVGRGGMSYVYLAEDVRLPGKQWAVKASLRHAYDPRGFEEEARMLAALDHPFLSKVADFFPPDDTGYSYLVTDFIKGETLQARFEKGELTVRRVMDIAVQLCELFDYLHRLKPKPVIYRDLKPSNVMLDEQEHVRLIDFGIARTYTAGAHADTVSFGTIGFASPEQLDGGATDVRSDLYSLGAMIYYLLYQGTYYKGGELPDSSLVPAEFRKLLTRLLERNPDRRFQSAKELGAEISRLLRNASISHSSENADQIGSRSTDAAYPLNRQILVVGGMYPGAGSTFFSLALCRALHRSGIGHTLIEFPANEPELFNLLHGSKNAPSRVRVVQDLLEGTSATDRRSWTSGCSEWLPLDPDRAVPNPDSFLRLLSSVKSSFVILDLSRHWDHPAAKEWIALADAIVAVASPHPSKLAAPVCRRNVKLLTEWQKSGRPVRIAGNRDSDFVGRREWLDCLPDAPVVALPELPGSATLEAEWKGLRIQDDPVHGAALAEALRPLLKELLPGSLLNAGQRQSRLRSFFQGKSSS